mmetsp:Transcript_15861/g.43420  ORF Transcript_15861/g.43420 Transcript_15861/m.43420 type:complete len:369 (+) Transcript_15861:130-1236(+)
MVVAQVVHVKNATSRTFLLTSGDPFYTPRLQGVPWKKHAIEVPPDFDESCEVVIPWSAVTNEGLVISEVDSEAKLRCIIGPSENDALNLDWLQLHSSEWEPIAQERWKAVGERHYFGAIGGTSDWQITFTDAGRMEAAAGPLEDIVHFDRPNVVAPLDTVFLNVYDLLPSMSIPNAILCNTCINTIGAFHAAVEVYGEEWSFYRTPSAIAAGICRSSRPRSHPVHVYRQSINLGRTGLKDWEVHYLIRSTLAVNWPGGAYDLLHRNCIHFCDELLLSLGVRAVPQWVRGLHETGASVFRVSFALSSLFGGTLALPAFSSANPQEEPEEAAESSEKQAIDFGMPPPDANFIEVGVRSGSESVVSDIEDA